MPAKIYGWRNFFEVLNTTEKFEFTTWERIEGHMQHSTMVICKKRCVQNIQIEAFSSHLCSILFNLLDHKWLGILSSQGAVINLVIVCCGAIRSKSWSHPRLQNRNLSWAMVGRMVHHYLYKIQNQAMGPRVLIGFGGVYWSGT